MDLQKEMGLAYLFISHGLSVVAPYRDDVMVMYLGKPVETGKGRGCLRPSAPSYTAALLSATPIADPTRKKTRIQLTGELPSPLNPPPGCPFNPRCPRATDECRQPFPAESGEASHRFFCYHPL